MLVLHDDNLDYNLDDNLDNDLGANLDSIHLCRHRVLKRMPFRLTILFELAASHHEPSVDWQHTFGVRRIHVQAVHERCWAPDAGEDDLEVSRKLGQG